MKVGQKQFIVKTLSGEFISVRSSKLMVRADIQKAEENGHECVVIELTIDAIHTKEQM